MPNAHESKTVSGGMNPFSRARGLTEIFCNVPGVEMPGYCRCSLQETKCFSSCLAAEFVRYFTGELSFTRCDSMPGFGRFERERVLAVSALPLILEVSKMEAIQRCKASCFALANSLFRLLPENAMRKIIFCSLFALLFCAQGAEPLRVFIRAGPKTHGPDQHDGPRFLREYTKLLNERGAKTTGKIGFPTSEELNNTDVLVLYSAEGGTIAPDDRKNLENFLKRGGGVVSIHDSVCGTDPQWFKTIIGGAWEHGHSKWLEGDVGMYFVDTDHPITRGISNFDFHDEIYYDLHMMPEAHVLATSFHSVFVIAPQMWTYEKDNYRSFVCVPGHEWSSFELPHFRAILLRGIAWAGKRENVDMLCTKEELGSLKYPQGGPTKPEKEAEKLVVHPDFNINLVASEPLIEKAISLDWDPQGHLWVAETPEYPNGRNVNKNDEMVELWSQKDTEKVKASGKEDRPARDRISWLEDTNGDGVMDKKHVFADGLELVTSMVFYKDGVIVAQAPDILWLRDSNGDGKCDMKDEKVLLYTGFGTFDTHAVINNFRWGMDGWVYGAVGYSAGDPASPDGKKFGRVTAGIIRFKPDGSGIEQVASGSCNTWGFDFAPDGEMFYTTATCGEHFLHVVMPEKILAKGNVGGIRSSAVVPDHQKVFPLVHHTRPAYVQIDWVGQFTAAAGSCIYNGGAWPERYNNTHFVSEPTVSLVHNDWLKAKGVTFTAGKEPGREENEFIAGTDLWFRPVHTRVGPDGALYVIDFYNQAAIHNDTRGPKHGARNASVRPDRDHHFGRIWRVQHKQARPLPPETLDIKNPDSLVHALQSPNGWTRWTAQRLLVERGNGDVVPSLKKLAMSKDAAAFARVHALWSSYLLTGKHDPDLLTAVYNDTSDTVRKSAMQLLRNYPIPATMTGDALKPYAALFRSMTEQLRNPEGRLRLETLMAISSAEPTPPNEPGVAAQFEKSLWDVYNNLDDPWTESALIGIFSAKPEEAILAAAGLKDATKVARTVKALADKIAVRNDANAAAALLVNLSEKPDESVKQIVLDSFSKGLKETAVADWTPEVQKSFRGFVASQNARLAAAALPLIARWDKDGSLTEDIKPIVKPLVAKLNDSSLSEDDRAQVAASLIGVRKLDSQIIPTVVSVLNSSGSIALNKRIIESLGSVFDAEVGKQLVAAYPNLAYELRDPAFGQLIKRAEWSSDLLDAIQAKKVDLAALGPAALHRLRTHSDKQIAARAGKLIDEIRGPEAKEKDKIIADFLPMVEQQGNVETGHKMFTQNCASCHRFKGEGANVAPDLTGMGAHGPHELLIHILDPNRFVEPNFVTTSIETKDDLSYDGIISRENQTSVVLRNATGEFEIRQDNIKSRKSTGLSLMPVGFEAMGKENLRDLLSFISADENRFRVIDLGSAFTVDSSKGIFNSRDAVNETLAFRKFGLTSVEGIPFDVVSPIRSASGKNLVVLKGGHNFSRALPQKVEVPVKVKAGKLHFLGGVAGWGYPCCGEDKNEKRPVLKVTVRYADKSTHEIVIKNGVEIADYIAKYDVPGSKEAPGLLRHGQVRWFTKVLPKEGLIEKLTIESYDNDVAPTLVAITAESGATPAQANAGAAPGAESNKNSINVLIVGGGTSHDFNKWFNQADTETLSEGGLAKVEYSEDIPSVLGKLKGIDVLYLSNNQPMKDPELRKAIFAHVESGKGLVLVHPALWYNWNDWPEYNSKLVGGGAHSHEKYGRFDVTVVEKEHPIMRGVPETFTINDELYHSELDPHGAAVKVLAKATVPGSEKTYPSVWVTENPKGRIACIALGHDGAAHQGEAYKTILRNAVKWAAGK
jgi:putative membrane-bound dehydrogenase-like protein